MKNAKLFPFIAATISALTLSACGGGSSPSSESQMTPIPHSYSIPDQFSKGDGNAHLDKPEKAVDTIRIHYHRFDDSYGDFQSYLNWSLWLWDYSNGLNGQIAQFNRYDDYGVYLDVPASFFDSEMTEMGFIVCCYSNGNWYGKDPDGDRYVKFEGTAPGGVKDVYLVSGSSNVYDDPNNPLKSSIRVFRMDASSASKVRLVFNEVASDPIEFDAKKLKIYRNGELASGYTVGDYASKAVDIAFPSPLALSESLSASYEFDDKWTDSRNMIITTYFDSKEFNDNYYYDGDDLGATFDDPLNPTKTIFKVWAPTSSSVKLNLYASGDYRVEDAIGSYEMQKGPKGVFVYEAPQDLDGRYYTYSVTNSAGTNMVVDPYAKSAGLNGKRGMVVNFARINQEVIGWNSDVRPTISNPASSSIYEIHVRDMTINANSGVSEANRGRFLGLTETGTTFTKDNVTVSTGLDHIAELGVSHVQIQPFYDYSSVDEANVSSSMQESNYNWGYDPQNYNALEGSYSSNPIDGSCRIKEFKRMVMALHQKGLNINMDVVYNHTAATENSNFQLLVPYYYYRTSSSGSFYNGSGCGNEVASNREMMRKFIVDSTKFWTDEYHLSGFRFDLMGLEDNQTMIDVYHAVTQLYPQALIYGEPWDMGSLKSDIKPDNLSGQKTLQGSLSQPYFYGSQVYVGAFNDVIRNAIRGENGAGNKGYVQGVASHAKQLAAGMSGLFRSDASTLSPIQCINYASCHDNYTLYDQLIQGMPSTRAFDPAYSQANALVLFSQGVAFLQEGDDFMRSKVMDTTGEKVKYCDNSYNVGDFINNMDYSLKAEQKEMFELTKDMVAFRHSHGALTLPTREQISSSMGNVSVDDEGNISYRVNDGVENLMVCYSLNGTTLSNVSGTLVFSNLRTVGEGTSISALTLGANEVAVVRL